VARTLMPGCIVAQLMRERGLARVRCGKNACTTAPRPADEGERDPVRCRCCPPVRDRLWIAGQEPDNQLHTPVSLRALKLPVRRERRTRY
jgi:hypothetical protein